MTQNKKNVKIITFPQAFSQEQVTFEDTNHLAVIPDEYRARINTNWEKNHKGWTSSPLATLEKVIFDETHAHIQTGVTDYKDYAGAMHIAKETGDFKPLEISKAIGNQVIMRTLDSHFIFARREDGMVVCPSEYNCGGGLSAVVYAMKDELMNDRKKKLGEKEHLPPNARYTEEELAFPFNDALEHGIRRISEEYGLKRENVQENTLRLHGLALGITAGVDCLISFGLKLTIEQYLKMQKETIDWLENTTGKPQPKKRQEVEHTVFIKNDILSDFLCNKLEQDSLGNKFIAHPKTGRYEIVDTAITTGLLYVYHTQQKKYPELSKKLEEAGITYTPSQRKPNGTYNLEYY